MKRFPFPLGWYFIFALAAGATYAAAGPTQWVQIRAVIHYTRSGTIATAPEGHFTYKFDAELEQMMERVPPGKGESLAAYVVTDDYTPVFKLIGKATMDGNVTQSDANGSYSASAGLAAALNKREDFHLEEIKPADPFGKGFIAKFNVAVHMKGSVSSSYPRMPGVTEEDAVLLWPCPVKHDNAEGFLSEGELTLFPVPGPRPKDEQMGMIYDMVFAADTLPTMGGFRPPSIGSVTTVEGPSWRIDFKNEKATKLPSLGGTYTETISIEIKPVTQTLPTPKRSE